MALESIGSAELTQSAANKQGDVIVVEDPTSSTPAFVRVSARNSMPSWRRRARQ